MVSVQPRVLVVDDRPSWHENLRYVLKGEGFETVHVEDSSKWRQAVGNDRLDLALVDLRMESADGHAVLEGLKDLDWTVPVIIVTAFPSLADCVRAVKNGAFDFVDKAGTP